MESLTALIEQLINDRTLITATLSQVRYKGENCTKVQVKPVELKGSCIISLRPILVQR